MVSVQSPSKSQHNSSKTWKEQFSNSSGKAKKEKKQKTKTKTKNKNKEIAKTILTMKERAGGNTIPDLKL